MRIVRTFACTPGEFFDALEARFLRECTERGVDAGALAVGSGYGDELSSTTVTAVERGRLLGWSARSVAGAVESTIEISADDDGCQVTFEQLYPQDAAAKGKLSQALVFGQMSNMLIGVFNEVGRRREGSDGAADVTGGLADGSRPASDSLSLKLFKRFFAR